MIDYIQILYYLRAVLFGISVGIAINLFFKYFKTVVEDLLTGGKFINVDLWWWTGRLLAIVLGLLATLYLL